MNVDVAVKNEYPIDFAKVKETAIKLGLNEKFVELLFRRGVSDEDKIKRFLYPDESMFYDPFLLKGMDEAVTRLSAAIENKEKIVVYGDYDADGVCAAAILALFLRGQGLKVYVHIPNRVGEGYGLNVDTLGRIIESEFPDLILTCDCGISGAAEVNYAIELGVDVIVTDHHEISGEIPDCIVINPKQPDCNYPYDMLCGAGVALKLIEAMSDRQTMLEYTDLACVATIADLVPLMDENRLIVQFGLQRVNERKNIGLSVMFDMLKLDKISSGDVAFKVAPRINAAGRMGDAYRAFDLLTTEDVSHAVEITNEIEADNAKRKSICDEMYDEAVGDLAYEDLVNSRAIVLSHPSWEKGITGILAARLAGDYNRPAFILVRSGDDSYKGTCRSVDGVNVHELLTYCRDELIEFGGHNQAAGFSIDPSKKEAFAAKANEFLQRFDAETFFPHVNYDMDLTDPSPEFVKSLDLLEPTGNGNTKPLFRLTVTDVTVAPCKSNQNHISVTLPSGLQIFAFNYSKLSYQLLGASKKDIITELQMSSYGNGRQIKGIMRTVKPEKLYIGDAAAEGYKYALLKYLPKSGAKYRVYAPDELADEPTKPYGTLFIAFNRDSYERFTASHDIAVHEFNYVISKNNFTRIIVAPILENNVPLANYEKIVFLDTPINTGVVSYLNSVTNAEILLPANPDEVYGISTEREVMTAYYEVIRRNQNVSSPSSFAWFRTVSKTEKIALPQLTFCVVVFAELGLIDVSNDPYRLTLNKGVRADLDASVVYRAAKEGK